MRYPLIIFSTPLILYFSLKLPFAFLLGSLELKVWYPLIGIISVIIGVFMVNSYRKRVPNIKDYIHPIIFYLIVYLSYYLLTFYFNIHMNQYIHVFITTIFNGLYQGLDIIFDKPLWHYSRSDFIYALRYAFGINKETINADGTRDLSKDTTLFMNDDDGNKGKKDKNKRPENFTPIDKRPGWGFRGAGETGDGYPNQGSGSSDSSAPQQNSSSANQAPSDNQGGINNSSSPSAPATFSPAESSKSDVKWDEFLHKHMLDSPVAEGASGSEKVNSGAGESTGTASNVKPSSELTIVTRSSQPAAVPSSSTTNTSNSQNHSDTSTSLPEIPKVKKEDNLKFTLDGVTVYSDDPDYPAKRHLFNMRLASSRNPQWNKINDIGQGKGEAAVQQKRLAQEAAAEQRRIAAQKESERVSAMVIENKRTELLTLITSLDDKTRRVMHNSKDSLDRDIKTVEDKVHTAYSNSVASLHDPQGHASHVANFNNLVQERQRLLARVSAYDKESKQEYVDLNRSTIAARLMIERGSPEEIISLHKELIGDISKSDGNNNNN